MDDYHDLLIYTRDSQSESLYNMACLFPPSWAYRYIHLVQCFKGFASYPVYYIYHANYLRRNSVANAGVTVFKENSIIIFELRWYLQVRLGKSPSRQTPSNKYLTNLFCMPPERTAHRFFFPECIIMNDQLQSSAPKSVTPARELYT